VFVHEFLDPCKLDSREAATALQPDWIEPKLSHAVVSFDMNMCRFSPITREKEEAVRTYAKDCGHSAAYANVLFKAT
jgi:hypothetical protein